ncbi:hypothetical protein Q8A73_007567 [Channa argus]|nr:hypothetical protein Q8A73_007567 [Channa argus]
MAPHSATTVRCHSNILKGKQQITIRLLGAEHWGGTVSRSCPGRPRLCVGVLGKEGLHICPQPFRQEVEGEPDEEGKISSSTKKERKKNLEGSPERKGNRTPSGQRERSRHPGPSFKRPGGEKGGEEDGCNVLEGLRLLTRTNAPLPADLHSQQARLPLPNTHLQTFTLLHLWGFPSSTSSILTLSTPAEEVDGASGLLSRIQGPYERKQRHAMCGSEGRWTREEGEEADGVFGKHRESRRERPLGRRGRGEGEVEEREHKKGDRQGSYAETHGNEGSYHCKHKESSSFNKSLSAYYEDMRVEPKDDKVLISKPTHSQLTQRFPLTPLFYLRHNNSSN